MVSSSTLCANSMQVAKRVHRVESKPHEVMNNRWCGVGNTQVTCVRECIKQGNNRLMSPNGEGEGDGYNFTFQTTPKK